MRALLVAALAASAVTALSCNVHQYCLNCEANDGGGGSDGGGGGSDGGIDAPFDGGSNCVPSPEVCDGSDNDCDGIVDEDPTDSDIGSACPNQKGDCAGGVFQCKTGHVVCSKLGSPEICDNRDNDCDGVIDNGNPGDGVTQGGSKCGTDTGECVAGTNTCVNGAIQCIGRVNPTPETCDGKDNDCDGSADNGLSNLGTCGGSAVGACHPGTLTCGPGGVAECQNAQGPTFEICNGIDDDCDGVIDNGFNLKTDPENCGACGNVCALSHAFAGCAITAPATTPACTVAACQSGFHDNNKVASDGCEFGPCTITGNEVCNGLDDDCDGSADDNLGAAPNICLTKGACAGAVAQCKGAEGFVCNYGGNVSTDGSGDVVNETACDGIDNDCDGKIDEGQPNLGQACHDNGIGQCQGTGHFACDAANPNGPAICVIDKPGKTPSPEVCDNIDNDCDGKIDNGGSAGNLIGQNWVNIGNHFQMMQFEASRPDATGSDQGAVSTEVCSQANVEPWTDITYPQALAACQSVGASLCTEQQWHRTCGVIAPTEYPIALAAAGNVSQTVEAEDYFANTPSSVADSGSVHAWVEDYLVDSTGRSFSGISDMQAVPDDGTNIDLTGATDIRTISPRLDYEFTMQKASSTYIVWLLMDSPNNNATRIAVGFDGVKPSNANNNARVTQATLNTWQWVQVTTTFTLAAGTHTLNVYMARDGVKLDAINITDAAGTPAVPQKPAGNEWSYFANPNTSQTGVCNDHNFDGATDNTIPTGTDVGCKTQTAAGGTGGGVFDLSGNVKEWVLAHLPNQDPIRGGASNNVDTGTTCPLNFTLADDTFFFPNVGFRCCRVGGT